MFVGFCWQDSTIVDREIELILWNLKILKNGMEDVWQSMTDYEAVGNSAQAELPWNPKKGILNS